MNFNDLFCDISYSQQNCKDEKICGDTFLWRHTPSKGRTLAVLSDGMGHGVKANILSSLTASMIINFDFINQDITEIAHMVINALPICSVRKLSYSTFSIVDINHITGVATIIEYDNPQALVYRGGEPLKCNWKHIVIDGDSERMGQIILSTSFQYQSSDRIVIMSDGVTQSGLGKDQYPFGWRRKNVDNFIRNILELEPTINSLNLSRKVLSESIQLDNGYTNDDISCAVITVRETKQMLLLSCPPSSDKENEKLIDKIDSYQGEKIICGYHLAKLISELKGVEISKDKISLDPDLQPVWHMEGIDLISESLATLNKVFDMLQETSLNTETEGAASDICKLLLLHDKIDILIGMRRGNGGIYMIDGYELRRKVLKHIARLLKERYSKDVIIEYI